MERDSITLSLCMIVKDEEDNLNDCILPVKSVFDEIIVVDTGSKDKTPQIARALGARVYRFKWIDDFSAARNESIRHATSDYIMWLDADDRMKREEIEKLKTLKSQLPFSKDVAYFLILHSHSTLDGDMSMYQLRIFPNIDGISFEGAIHENISASLKRRGIRFEFKDIVIDHKGYQDREAVLKKINRNLEIAKRHLKANPNDPILIFHVARTLSAVEKYRDAINYLRLITEDNRFLKKARDLFHYAAFYRVKYHLEINELDEAKRFLERIDKDFSDSPVLSLFMGITLYKLKEYERAIYYIKRSLKNEINVSRFPLNLNQIYFNQYFILAMAHIHLNRKKEAEEYLLKSVNIPYKEVFRAYEELGKLYLQTGRYDKAVQCFKKAIELGRRIDINYSNLGLSYKKLGDRNNAIEAFNEALKLNPKRSEALLNLAHIYFEKGDLHKAEELFKEALKCDNNFIDAHLVLSEIYFRFGNYEDLIEECNQIIKILSIQKDFEINDISDLGTVYYHIGCILKEHKRFDLALLAYYVAFLISPEEDLMDEIINFSKEINRLDITLSKIKDILSFYNINLSN